MLTQQIFSLNIVGTFEAHNIQQGTGNARGQSRGVRVVARPRPDSKLKREARPPE